MPLHTIVEIPQGDGVNNRVPEQPAATDPPTKPLKPNNSNSNKASQRKCCTGWNVTLVLCGLVLACGIAALCYHKASEHSGDQDKFSDYYPFEWTFADDGVLIGEPSESFSIQVTTLDACKQFCEELDYYTSGNYFEQIGVAPTERIDNCFCMRSFICVAHVVSEEDGEVYAPEGTAFSKTRRVKSPTCDQTYCEFGNSLCS